MSSNKTVIVTLTRTGSTFLNLKLAKENNLYSFGEILNHNTNVFDKRFETNFNVDISNLNTKLKNNYIFNSWYKLSNSICRLIPDQTKDELLVEKYLQCADKIIYHYII